MLENINEISHRRFNILTGEWVQVSPHRSKRPWQGKVEKLEGEQRPEYDENCYLCPGNTRANGAQNPDYKDTFVFQNDFAALQEDIEEQEVSKGLLVAKSEKGLCKVICFSPRHDLTLPQMEVEDIEKVVALWKKEYETIGALPYINHVQIFENKGEMMGCSNPHPHGQIWAQESIPVEVAKKNHHLKSYYKQEGKSLLAAYLDQEMEEQERILWQNEHFVVLVPFWAIWPFETMIIPKKHQQHIGQLSDQEATSFAEALQWITIRYDNLFETSFPYSAGIHQAPTNGKDQSHWHWHMSFYPPLLRSATVKKFMVGYELFANPQRDITAEQAAERLRQLPDQHYLKTDGDSRYPT